MKINEITRFIEELFPLENQEVYDNCGLLVGDSNMEINGVLICFDVTEEVVEEAVSMGFNLIISHHPFIFKGVKKVNYSSPLSKILVKAIKKDIAIYAAHTNIDNSAFGINKVIADLLQLKNVKILRPIEEDLLKVVVFCPDESSGEVRDAMFKAGCGNIGNYDNCSYNTQGLGTFRANEKARPFVGNMNELHFESEVRIETIVSKHKLKNVIEAIIRSHPYEEVAYDVYALQNQNPSIGAGIIGDLQKTMPLSQLFSLLKEKIGVHQIRYNSSHLNKEISRVSYCGGSGAFLISDAISQKADVFISADIKYHDFFDYQNRLVVADIGHFESEHMIQDILFDRLTKKFPKFAVLKTKVSSNPINYF